MLNKFGAILVIAGSFGAFLCACSDDSSSKASDETINSSVDSTEVDTSAIDSIGGDSTVVDSAALDSVDLPVEGPITMPSGLGFLFDDFEDGNHQAKNEDYWYTYTDNDNEGASIITTPLNDDGNIVPARVNNGSNYALKINYTLDKGSYEFDPYVGWGVQIAENDSNGHFGGISYWYKGGAHEVHIEVSDVKDYDVHLAKVKASRTWTQAVIRFKDLTQGGWGIEVPFDAKHIKAISFQAKGSGSKIITDSLFIDNVYLQDTSEVEKDKADLTINDPMIPKVNFTEDEITVNTPLQAKAMKYLDKGVSFTNWLEEDKAKFKTFEFDDKDVKILADNGFKSLRLPIDLDLYALNRDEFVAGKANSLIFDDDSLFLVLDSFDKWTHENNMSFVIDWHEYDNSYNSKSALDSNYIKMMANVWKHVAAHFATNSREDIFFELLNEPDMSDGKVKAADWTIAAQAIIDSIRTVDKAHTLLFGDVKWYSITELAKRTPFTDDNIIYVIHTYEPFAFTHQGASWTDYGSIKNIPFPYSKEEWSEYSGYFGVNKSTVAYVKTAIKNYYKTGNKESILNQVLVAKKWAAKNQVPVIINEFGAMNTRSTAQHRLNYLTAMREISDTLQIPLTHWGYTGNFSVIENGKIIDGVGEALGIK